MTWKCNSCGGTYVDVQRDGTIYQHVCGDEIRDATGAKIPVANKRDENLKLDLRGRASDIISAGTGVTPLSGQMQVEPQWLTAMRGQYQAAIAKEA